MKLFEHPDFDQAMLATREHLLAQGMAFSEQIIEKDYYVTEALRIITRVGGNKVIFRCTKMTADRLEAVPGTITICINWPNKILFAPS